MSKHHPIPAFAHADVQRDHRGVYTLQIRGAKSVNILNSAVMSSATGAATWISEQADARAVVVRGAGEKAFVAGADVYEMASLSPDSARGFISRLRDLCEAVRQIPVPTVARIPGFCLGGGLELAAACDIRLASDASTFGMPEVKVGIPSVIHAALLPRLVGVGATNWLLLTGETIDAAQALRWGFLQFTSSPEELDALVERTIAPIVSSGPLAMRAQKVLNRYWEESSAEDGIALSVQKFGESFESPEPATYMASFTQRPRHAAK